MSRERAHGKRGMVMGTRSDFGESRARRIRGGAARVARAGLAALCSLALALALVPCAALSGAPSAEAASGNSYGFPDVAGTEWFATDDILGYAVDEGIIQGYSSTGCLGAYDAVTRAQMAVVLWRLAGCPEADADDFEDVDYTSWYGDAIEWARSTGVITGYQSADGEYRYFKPSKSIARQEMALMMARFAASIEGIVTDTDGEALAAFPDASDVASWAEDGVAWCVDAGLMSGKTLSTGNYIKPTSTAQRCEMAKMAVILARDVMAPDVGEECSYEYAEGVVEGDEGLSWGFDENGDVLVLEEEWSSSASGLYVNSYAFYSQVCEADIVVLPATDAHPDGYAIVVDSVSKQRNVSCPSEYLYYDSSGLAIGVVWSYATLIEGEQAEAEDVFEELYLEGTQAEWSLEPEDGVDAVSISKSISTQSWQGTVEADSCELSLASGTTTLTADDGTTATITGSAMVTVAPSAEYLIDFSWSGGFEQLYLAAKADIDFEASLKVSASGRYKLATLGADVSALGCTVAKAAIGVYLVAEVDGSVTFTYGVEAVAGVNYTAGHANFIATAEGDDMQLEAEVSATLGVGVEAELAALDTTIADAAFDVGAKADAEVTVRSSGLNCLDLQGYLFLDVNVGAKSALMQKFGLTYSESLFDADSSPLAVHVHVENGVTVDECTWSEAEDMDIDDDAVTYNGHSYCLYDLDDIDTWEAAEEYCESMGGYLACITDSGENDFLYSYITSLGYTSAYFGLSMDEDGTWTWVNGETLDYLNWADDEPSFSYGTEYYAMFYYQFTDGTWNDGDFGNYTWGGDTSFICEWDAA